MNDNYFVFTRRDGLEVPSYEIGSITEKPIIPRATRNIKHIPIEGRDGTLTEDTGSYNNIEIPFKLVNYKENLFDKEIIGVLDGTGGELYISWLNGNFKVKEINTFNITEEVNGVFRVELVFICAPFRNLEEEVAIITDNNSKINISGNRETDHVTRVYGNGNISLLINDEQINFKEVTDYICMDTLLLECYKDVSLNDKMVGEFLKLKPGQNTIAWIGNVTKIEIEYRGRYLN